MAKTVPLVVYLDDGTRKVIGTADVEDDGSGNVIAKGHITEEEFCRKFEVGSRLFSLSVGSSDDGSYEASLVEPSPIQKMDLGAPKYEWSLPKSMRAIEEWAKKEYPPFGPGHDKESDVHTEGT